MLPDQHKADLQLERYPRSLDVKGSAKIAHKVAEDRVISTVDPEARHTCKSSEARRDGYRAHVAADPETGVITNEKLTGACGEQNTDPAVAEEFVAAQAAGTAWMAAWPGTATRPMGPGSYAMRSAALGTRR